jgi:hypothetical protein
MEHYEYILLKVNCTNLSLSTNVDPGTFISYLLALKLSKESQLDRGTSEF